MSEYYKYIIFGLNVLSSIPIPEISVTSFDKEDVKILVGKNPKVIKNSRDTGVLYQAKKNHFLLSIHNLGSIYVTNGNLISVEKKKNADDNDIRLFLLGPGFGALIHQLGSLPMHGSSVVKNGKSILFCGLSGIGKSSLAAILCQRGYSLLADDISVISNKGTQASIIPGIQQLKLWHDVMEKLNKDIRQFEKVRSSILRYKVPIPNNKELENNKLIIVYILEKKNTPGFQLIEVKGTHKFELLKINTYRDQYLVGLETMEEHFYQLSKLMQNTKVYRIIRPSSPLLIQELADFVEKSVASFIN